MLLGQTMVNSYVLIEKAAESAAFLLGMECSPVRLAVGQTVAYKVN